MKPLKLHLPVEQIPSYERRARQEGKPLAAWLRDVLIWYLGQPRRRRGRGTEAAGYPVAITARGRVRCTIPKAERERLGISGRAARAVLSTTTRRIVLTLLPDEAAPERPGGGE